MSLSGKKKKNPMLLCYQISNAKYCRPLMIILIYRIDHGPNDPLNLTFHQLLNRLNNLPFHQLLNLPLNVLFYCLNRAIISRTLQATRSTVGFLYLKKDTRSPSPPPRVLQ